MNSAIGSYDFSVVAPAGYYIALRVGFAYPMSEQNALPAKWVEAYTEQGFMLFDPVMKWVYANNGTVRWSALKDDPHNILQKAARFGLRYGVAISCIDKSAHGQRSFGSFARTDREFTDDEIDTLQQNLRALHASIAPPTNLTKAELEVLEMVKNGLLMKEIANQIGVSQGAIKQRLKNAKLKLNAKTSSQAAALALEYGLI